MYLIYFCAFGDERIYLHQAARDSSVRRRFTVLFCVEKRTIWHTYTRALESICDMEKVFRQNWYKSICIKLLCTNSFAMIICFNLLACVCVCTLWAQHRECPLWAGIDLNCFIWIGKCREFLGNGNDVEIFLHILIDCDWIYFKKK